MEEGETDELADQLAELENYSLEEKVAHLWALYQQSENELTDALEQLGFSKAQHETEMKEIEAYVEQIRSLSDERETITVEFEKENEELRAQAAKERSEVCAILERDELNAISNLPITEQVAFILVEKAKLADQLEQAKVNGSSSEVPDCSKCKDYEEVKDKLIKIEEQYKTVERRCNRYKSMLGGGDDLKSSDEQEVVRLEAELSEKNVIIRQMSLESTLSMDGNINDAQLSELETLRTQISALETQVSELKSELQKQRETSASELENVILNYEEKLESDGEVQSGSSTEGSKLVESLKSQIKQIRLEHEKEIMQYQNELEQVLANHEEELERGDNLSTQLEEAAKLNQELANKLEEYHMTIQSLHSEHEELKDENMESLLKLDSVTTEYEQIIDKLSQVDEKYKENMVELKKAHSEYEALQQIQEIMKDDCEMMLHDKELSDHRINELDNMNRQLQDELNKTSEQGDVTNTMSIQLQERTTLISDLESRVETVTKQLDESESAREQLHKQLENINSDSQLQSDQLTQVQKTLEQQLQLVETLKGQLSLQLAETKNVREQLITQTNDTFHGEEERIETQAKIDLLQTELDMKNAELVSLRENVSSQEKTILTLRDSLKEVREDRDDLKLHVTEFEHELELFKQESSYTDQERLAGQHEVSEMKAEVGRYVVQLDDRLEAIHNLEKQIREYEKEMSEHIGIEIQLRTRLQQLETSQLISVDQTKLEQRTEKQVSEYMERYESSQLDLTTLTQKYETCQSDLLAVNEKLKSCQSDVLRLTEENKELSEQSEEHRERMKQLKRDLEEVQTIVEKKTEDNTQLQYLIDSETQQLSKLQSMQVSKDTELSELRSLLHSKETENSELCSLLHSQEDKSSKIQFKDKEIVQLRSLVQSNEEDFSEIQGLLESKEKEILELRTSLQTKEIKLSEVRSHVLSEEQKVVDLQAFVNTKEDEYLDLQAVVHNKEDEILELRSLIDTKDDEIERLTVDHQDAIEQLERTVADFEESRRHSLINSSMDSNIDLESSLRDKDLRNAELTDRLILLEKAANQLEEDNRELALKLKDAFSQSEVIESNFTREKQQLKSANTRLQEQIDRVKKYSEATEKDLESAQEKIKHQTDKLKNISEVKETEILSLKTELTHLRSEHRKQVDSYTQRIKQLELDNQTLQENINMKSQELSQHVRYKSELIDNLEGEKLTVKKLDNKITQLQQEADKSFELLQDTKEKKMALEQENLRIVSDMNTLVQKVDSNNMLSQNSLRLTDSSKALELVESRLTAMEKQRDDLRSSLYQVNSELNKSNETLKDYTDLKDELQQRKDELIRIKTQLEEQRTKRSFSDSQIESLKLSLESVKERETQTQETNHQLRHRILDMEAQLSSSESKNNNSNHEVQTLESKIKSLTNRLSNLQQEKETLELELLAANEKLQLNIRRYYDRKRKDKSKLNNRKLMYVNEINKLKDKMEYLERDLKLVKSSLERSESLENQAESRCSTLNEEKRFLNSKIVDLDDEIRERNRAIALLQTKLQYIEQENSQLQELCEKLKLSPKHDEVLDTILVSQYKPTHSPRIKDNMSLTLAPTTSMDSLIFDNSTTFEHQAS